MDYGSIKTVRITKNQVRAAVVLAVLAASLAAFSALYLAGCTDTLDGELYENQKPIVYFANIPPEGGRFSRNETVYWNGTDPDGLIDYYRYHTVKVSQVGSQPPEDYILKVPDSEWVVIDVDSAQTDPQTENVIPLEADFDDPVNTYVSQWIFLQAFDMEGLGSEIVFRLFSRNDHPPETRINPIPSSYLPFVNDTAAGGIVTGVKLGWSGSDRLDYPEADWPPFEFEWRLYGPYDSSLFGTLVSSFVRCVFVTADGHVYELGDTAVFCDTTYGDSTVIRCDTFVVTDLCSGDQEVPSERGRLEKKFSVDDTNFINNPVFNRLVHCSCDDDPPPEDPRKNCVDRWVTTTSEVIYDVYKDTQFDTTVQMWFMFWVRSRDDAFVADLVPTFDSFRVIDPRFERDVIVVDFAGMPSASWCLPLKKERTAYWVNAIRKWRPEVVFDTTGIGGNTGGKGISPDYIDVAKTLAVPLVSLLKHKVIILYDDRISGWNFGGYSHNVYTAIDAGVNVWATWRVPLEPSAQRNDIFIPFNFAWYFGVSRMAYSNWFGLASAACRDPQNRLYDPARVEDFVGAYAIDSLEWPNLTIDTALLCSVIQWYPADAEARYGACLACRPKKGYFPFMPCGPALPEVNWSVRAPWRPTEVLYLYKSCYGSSHPLGGIYNMEGNPVAHRMTTTQFRTVHFNFTPLAIQQDSMQKVVNKVLDWLHPSEPPSPSAKIRYPDAPIKVSASQARERYWQRCEEQAQEMQTTATHGEP